MTATTDPQGTPHRVRAHAEPCHLRAGMAAVMAAAQAPAPAHTATPRPAGGAHQAHANALAAAYHNGEDVGHREGYMLGWRWGVGAGLFAGVLLSAVSVLTALYMRAGGLINF